MAPAYAMKGQAFVKADVYSFGHVPLLELLSRRRRRILNLSPEI